MPLCTLNITLGILEAKIFLTIEPKRLSGPFGKDYDDFFVFKNQRNCLFVPVLGFSKDDLGEKEGNSSALIMMQNNQVDVYTIFYDMTFVPYDDPFVEATKPTYANPYLVGQFMAPDQHTTDYTSFFLNKHLLLIILCGYLSIITLALAFAKIRTFNRIFSCLKLILSSVLYGIRQSAVRKLAILLLAFNLFMFINNLKHVWKTQ